MPDWVALELKKRKDSGNDEFDSTVETLLTSPQVGEVWRLLERTTVKGISEKRRLLRIVLAAVTAGLRGPDRYQRMTKGERKKLADNVQRTARKLRELVEPLLQYDMLSQFRVNLHFFSLESMLDYKEYLEAKDGDAGLLENGDVFSTCRSAVDWTLHRHGIINLLDLIEHSCESWSYDKQFLAMPNDSNANRLYFIRIVTGDFFYALDAPLRALTLALTSVFFECGDIDEASLSRLAPVPKRRTSRIDAAALSSGR